jgi:CspA family cold shock protein
MQTGTVRWFRESYGFIQPDEPGADVFCHITALTRAAISELLPDTKVRYDTEIDKKTQKIRVKALELVA